MITDELSVTEISRMLPYMVTLFKERYNQYDKRISASSMVKDFNNHGILTNETRIRKLINHIRNNDLLSDNENIIYLCSISGQGGGSWSTSNELEIGEHINSLKERRNELNRDILAGEEIQRRISEKFISRLQTSLKFATEPEISAKIKEFQRPGKLT